MEDNNNNQYKEDIGNTNKGTTQKKLEFLFLCEKKTTLQNRE